MKRLIVTADDVGLHRGMTLGAVRGHREGLVTACSVAACGPELGHAAALLEDCPGLDVGIHLMLVGGLPVSDPARVPTLVGSDGRLAPAYPAFVARYAIGRVSPREIEIEFRAQIERVLATGLTLVHANGHQHLHVLPQVFAIVTRLALEYGIRYVRIPEDRAPAEASALRRGAVAALGRLARSAACRARESGLCTNDRTIGIAHAGHLSAERLRRIVTEVDGVTELVTHPGIDGVSIGREYDWGYEWDAETAGLCDPALPALLAREGIALTGVRGLLNTAGPEGPAYESCRT